MQKVASVTLGALALLEEAAWDLRLWRVVECAVPVGAIREISTQLI